MDNHFMYTPPDYGPAIRLALNHIVGGIEIHDYMYDEEKDMWFVALTDENFGMRVDAFQLDGSFVRSCFKASKRGIKAWIGGPNDIS